ncbi:hypothetical protein [Longispora albida]|uniref:hypothetical protein n=1 Tax=Longispora albida TaxID=203523 RepID=UPI0003647771|nr:hypothetical protein [Longispora albida]
MGGSIRLDAARRTLSAVLAATMVAGGVVTGVLAAPPPAAAGVPVTVSVTLLDIGECCESNIDSGSGADYYASIWLDGAKSSFSYEDNHDFIEPGWRAEKVVDSGTEFVQLTFDVWDRDGGASGDDDHIDVSFGDTGDDHDYDARIDLHRAGHDCGVDGDGVRGFCNQTLETFGGFAKYPERARVHFKVEVTEPPDAPGLHIRCTHTPLWPQPNETVVITAETFSDQPEGQELPARTMDEIEIWYSTDDGGTRAVDRIARGSTHTISRTAGASQSRLAYGCRAKDRNTPAVFSGWKSVQVGDPPEGRVVPVMIGDSAKRHALDVVIIPASEQAAANPFFFPTVGPRMNDALYTDARDPRFIAHAGASVAQFWREQVMLERQRSVNIWFAMSGAATGALRDLMTDTDGDRRPDTLARDTTGDGIPDGDGIVDYCQHERPYLARFEYGWANARAILHPPRVPNPPLATYRDCAYGGVDSIFSSGDAAYTFVHETGHAGFGLSDEYCCDAGNRQVDPFPNVYASLDACRADVGNLGGVPADCTGYDKNGDGQHDYWVSDPPSAPHPTIPNATIGDIMNRATFKYFGRGDRRRIRWVFDLGTRGEL